MIELYTARTPNGRKVSIMLEETGLPYCVFRLRLSKGDQHHPDYAAFNPNRRIPAIRDTDNGLVIAESAAILLYLAEKSGQFDSDDPAIHYRALQWMMFQMGHVGPMLGQLGYFMQADPPNPHAVERFFREGQRILGVLNERLADSPYLAGEDYGIADMQTFPWVRDPDGYGFRIDDYPHLRRWIGEIGNRPAVQRGLEIPGDDAALVPWADVPA